MFVACLSTWQQRLIEIPCIILLLGQKQSISFLGCVWDRRWSTLHYVSLELNHAHSPPLKYAIAASIGVLPCITLALYCGHALRKG